MGACDLALGHVATDFLGVSDTARNLVDLRAGSPPDEGSSAIEGP